MIQRSRYTLKDVFGAVCLMVPLLAKWSLPPGLEEKLYVWVFDSFNIFIPNLLLLPLPFLFKKTQTIGIQKVLYVVWAFLSVTTVLLSDARNPATNIFSNFFILGAVLLGIFFKVSDNQVRLIKPALIFGAMLVCLQFIVLSAGLVAYDFDEAQEFGGIIRIYSTAGDSTGGGAIAAITGILSFYLLKSKFLKTVMALITIVAVFFTLSRSPIALVIAMALFITRKYFRINIKTIIGATLAIGILFIAGVFNPIIERQKNKSDSDDFTSGRIELQETVLRSVSNNDAFFTGLGIGNVYGTVEVLYGKIQPRYGGAPHNSYILIFAEQGVIGLMLLGVMLLIFIWKRFKRNSDLTVLFILICGTILMTETTIIVNSDYVFLLALLMMMINCEHKFEAYPERIKK